MTRIAYTKPSITRREIEYATDAAANGWGPRCYDYIRRFEDAFRTHIGSRFAIATSSCTGALHMGLAALNVGPGDEVILADTNWIATCAPIVHVGATPVFVDIDPQSWCIDPAKAEAAITPRTKAIVATHLYGNMADLDALQSLAERHGLALIEDAAEALGSQWFGGRAAGSLGTFGIFSFHGTKTLTTGEGGMFVTSDTALYERVSTLAEHGRAKRNPKQFWPEMVGFKYKMSNIEAALGLGQIERVEELVARKRAILSGYRTRLAGLEGLAMNPEPQGTRNGAWMPTLVFDRTRGITRERLQAAFAAREIDARVFFHPLSSLPMFAPVPENAHAWDIPTRAINLPSYHDMTDAEIDEVCEVVWQVSREAV